jgi:sulfate permease, SulP family
VSAPPPRRWLPGLRVQSRAQFFTDIVAGVITACVVIPQAIAYAGIAGLPAQAGLYVAFIPMVVYAFLGMSRVLSVSTTSTLSVLTATAIAVAGNSPDAAALLAIFAGIMLVVAGMLRAGFLANLVSVPILAGFKAGTGLVIIVGQLGKVLGIPVAGDNFIDKCVDLIRGLDDINGTTMALGVGTIVLLVLIRRFAPRVPGPLVAVVAGIILVAWLDLAEHGVAVIGSVPSGLPVPKVPDTDDWRLLLPAAAGIALLSFVESLAASRSLRRRDDPPVDPNRELVALGAANIGGGFFRGFPAGGGLSQSAVNADAGARSTLAGLVTAAVAAIVMTSLTGVLNDLAQATLGALVIVSAYGLVKPAELRRIREVRLRDGILGYTALAGVLLLGVLQGILLAIIISVSVLVAQAHRVPLDVLVADDAGGVRKAAPDEPNEMRPGLLALRIRGTLSFTNIDHVNTLILNQVDRCSPPPRTVLIDFTFVPELEVTGLDALTTLTAEIRLRGASVWMSGLDAALDEMVARHHRDDSDRRYPTLAIAVSAYIAETEAS